MILLVLFISVFVRFVLNLNMITNTALEYQENLHSRHQDRTDLPIQIYDNASKVIGRFYSKTIHKMNYQQCQKAKNIRDVAIMSEDSQFYNHIGISVYGILRAMFRNMITFSIEQGAGTITQQLARNLFTKSKEFKLTRKIYETYISLYLETFLSKDEILCLYLNNIYMGEGRVGAYEASKFYFNKTPQELSIPDSAMIIGILPAPTLYSPLNNIHFALKKQDLLLENLISHDYITKKQKRVLSNNFFTEYKIDTRLTYNKHGDIGKLGSNWYFDLNKTPDVNQSIRIYLLNKYSKEDLEKGMHVYTSIDLKKQQAATYAIRKAIKTSRAELLNNLHKDTKNKEYILNGLNGVFISLHPKTGDVLSMVTGYTHSEEGYINRAYEMYRQPGSVIKSFLYALAFEYGFFEEPPYKVVDKPINFNGYKPRNWYGNYKGAISLEEGIALSTNTIAVEVLDSIGISYFKSNLEKILKLNYNRKKINIPHNLTLALGSFEISPIELASIYSVMENGGYTIKPVLIKRIEDEDANIIFEEDFLDYQTEILSNESSFKILSILEKAMQNKNSTVHHIYQQLQNEGLHFSISSKTGSVSPYKNLLKKLKIKMNDQKGLVHDAWFASMVHNEVNVVWIGHDIGIPFRGSGGGLAAKVWFDYATRALIDKRNTTFSVVQNYHKNVSSDIEITDNLEEEITDSLEEEITDNLEEEITDNLEEESNEFEEQNYEFTEDFNDIEEEANNLENLEQF